jgi:hypothetical protein
MKLNYDILGIIAIVGSIIVFILREHIVRYRMSIWRKLNKSKNQKEIESAEKMYRFAVTFGCIILILLGTRLLFA